MYMNKKKTRFRTGGLSDGRADTLALQSQLYSDYKSSTTLKGLIGCDPNGSVIFISGLFTGSMSNKQITKQSGFLDVLEKMLDHG